MMTANKNLDQIGSNVALNLNNIYDFADIINDNDKHISTCNYYDNDEFNIFTKSIPKSLNTLHLNCRGLASNWDNFKFLINESQTSTFNFDIIGISEIFHIQNPNLYHLPGYHPLIFETRTGPNSKGGVGLYVKSSISHKIRKDISIFTPHKHESVFIEIDIGNKPFIIGVIYRPNSAPLADINYFSSSLLETIKK